MKALFTYCSMLFVTAAIAQNSCTDRLAILNKIETAFMNMNSALGDNGKFDFGAKREFEEAFEDGAQFPSFFFHLNNPAETIRVDQGPDPRELYSSDAIDALELDFLQQCRHLYQELPEFSIDVFHIDLKGDESVATARLTMLHSGVLRWPAEAYSAPIASNIQSIFPLDIQFAMRKKGGKWIVTSAGWIEDVEIPFSHFVQARVAGESGAHANWGSQSWDWGANAEQYHVVELGKGMYHILCPDSVLALHYNHPNYDHQSLCAAYEQKTIGAWLKSAATAGETNCTQLEFEPVKYRVELGGGTAPFRIWGLENGDGDVSSSSRSFIAAAFLRNRLQNKQSDVITTSGIEAAYGVFQTSVGADSLTFTSDATDASGDSYLRLVDYTNLTQEVLGKHISLGLSFGYSQILSDNYSLGLSARLGGVIRSDVIRTSSRLENIKGQYPQYYGVTFADDLYDFGSTMLETSTSGNTYFGGYVGLDLLQRREISESLSLYCRTGVLAEVFKHPKAVLVAETDFSLFDTQGTRLEIMPKLEVGLSKRILPRSINSCD